ncbi:TRAP transporter large permease [Lentibacter sp. XHP0401]|jgi:C4-dicarboxylate transporter, DctM subunit|uniref:TRAP transporter large permease n=1 Tax=Lentibacter sp. XHP0401 TaxID=2984334 RepID=UPI0021E7A01A|nr:TRAP transporter large permease subunit [Lentibacter sp. XHP0401]MCV2893419.1 TRAP transporter large permease subunit [Lentibacter sp. XHP0401]
MTDPMIALTLLALMIGLLAAGVWVAVALTLVGLAALVLFSSAPSGLILATTLWGHSHSWALTALPLFILMGEILLRSRMSDDMFTGLVPWLGRAPGRLLHVNVFGCAIFAAVSGSSAATAATIGRMSVPELTKRGYPESLILGTLAGSATLGLLIPPSIILIVYGVATEQSIARLFIAGILPGLMLISMFAGYVAVRAWMNPDLIPPIEESYTLREKLKASRRLIPVALLIGGVIGSIYAGLASPTDAAALGVVLAALLAWLSGSFSWKLFGEAVMSATRTSCMIALILLGAAFLSVAMGFTGLPRNLAIWIASMNLSVSTLLVALTIFFIVLGCFLDGISVIVLTTSIIMPMVTAVGIDPLWFGIYLVIVVEMSQITPPVGFNLFVIQGLTGIDILRVAKAAFPFFLLLLAGVVLITLFPQIVTVLPELMSR